MRKNRWPGCEQRRFSKDFRTRCLSITGLFGRCSRQWRNSSDINLFVIGTHGRRGVEKMLLGSIAEEILRCAQRPVLMVGPESSVAPETEARPRRILYATDFSPESEPAMHYACTLAKEYKATLFFLHVAEDVWKEPITTRMQAADFFRLRLMEKHWVLAEGVRTGVPR